MGDRIIRNRSAEVTDFGEFFQMEASKGTIIKIIPSVDKLMDPQEVGVVIIVIIVMHYSHLNG